MPQPSQASARRRRLSRHWMLGWLGVFLGCARLWGGEAILYHADWAEERDRKARLDELSTLLDPYLKQPTIPIEKLERDLNGSRPFDLPRALVLGGSYRCYWDPSILGPRFKGWMVELECGENGDRFTAFEGLLAYRTIAPHVRRANSYSAARAELETTRNIALLLGAGAWFVGMVTLFFARPWRRQIAQVCLAGVIIAAVAWSTSPTRAWQLAAFIAPLPIAIGSAGVVSLLALIIPLRRPEVGSSVPRCAGCGYDLTGNPSGICPECGRPTLRKRADRWQGQAEQLLAIAAAEPREVPTDL